MDTSTVEHDQFEEFRNGSRQAFDELYQLHAAALLCFLNSRCWNDVRAEDVAQETWIQVWHKHASFHGGNFRAWLFKLASNRKVDQARRYARRIDKVELSSVIVASVALPDNQEEEDRRNQETTALKECIESVGGKYVEVLKMRMQALNDLEIANRLSVQIGTVYSRANRGREELSDCVKRKLEP